MAICLDSFLRSNQEEEGRWKFMALAKTNGFGGAIESEFAPMHIVSINYCQEGCLAAGGIGR